nr:E3 ubiquitin-protein ligase TRIM39-like [Misgurnus anguillicaudatus]
MANISPSPVKDCYLCCSSLENSVVLKCCHSLCKSCLQSYWEFNKTLDCPVCLRGARCSVILQQHPSVLCFATVCNISDDGNAKPNLVRDAESEMREQSSETSDEDVDGDVMLHDVVPSTSEYEEEPHPPPTATSKSLRSNLCPKCGKRLKKKSDLRAHEKATS